jgi:hypothetical protein
MMIVPILCYRCFSSRQSRTFRCRNSGQSEEPNKLKNGDVFMRGGTRIFRSERSLIRLPGTERQQADADGFD